MLWLMESKEIGFVSLRRMGFDGLGFVLPWLMLR